MENPSSVPIILVADDDEANRKLFGSTLKGVDFQLVYCSNRQEAVDLMTKVKPQLLIVNHVSLGASALDIIKDVKARQSFQMIPLLVVLSDRASQEIKSQAIKFGVSDLIFSPLDGEELKLRVKNQLERVDLQNEVDILHRNDKLVELGRIFADLSHELKNILNAASGVPQLKKEQIEMAIAPIGLNNDFIHGLSSGFLVNEKNPDSLARFNSLQDLADPSLRSINVSLKAILAENSMPDDMMRLLWSEIQGMGADEVVFLENQLRLVSGFQTRGQILDQVRNLSLSALNFHRNTDGESFCELNRIWTDVFQLCFSSGRKYSVKWHVELPSVKVAISPVALTRILLNLCINSIDAMIPLPMGERWIRVTLRQEADMDFIRVENAGPAISPEVFSKLFTRGFSTKGTSGSGIGLYVSKGLAMQYKGDLVCDGTSSHPAFLISIPRSHRTI